MTSEAQNKTLRKGSLLKPAKKEGIALKRDTQYGVECEIIYGDDVVMLLDWVINTNLSRLKLLRGEEIWYFELFHFHNLTPSISNWDDWDEYFTIIG